MWRTHVRSVKLFSSTLTHSYRLDTANSDVIAYRCCANVRLIHTPTQRTKPESQECLHIIKIGSVYGQVVNFFVLPLP